jgi:hypothetical protein
MEVGEWLKDKQGSSEEVIHAFAAANIDGFMLSRMRDVQDLEDYLPPGQKAEGQAILTAAKQLMTASGSAAGGARTAYGKELGHDRFD